MGQGDTNTSVDPLWYKDAIIYELHVKTFCDSDGDGMGDFRGLMEKLDYLQELGVTAIWLLPFYPSPMRDDGYDIADYFDVNPNFGTLDDFRAFLDAAHERNLRVITELVINHTSDQNPWFQKSRRAAATATAEVNNPSSDDDFAYKDFYVWSETPEKYKDARIIFKDFETSNWAWDPLAKAYYWHRFYSHQPDLNFDNPAVHDAVKKVCDFWLSMGVDGVRLDAKIGGACGQSRELDLHAPAHLLRAEGGEPRGDLGGRLDPFGDHLVDEGAEQERVAGAGGVAGGDERRIGAGQPLGHQSLDRVGTQGSRLQRWFRCRGHQVGQCRGIRRRFPGPHRAQHAEG